MKHQHVSMCSENTQQVPWVGYCFSIPVSNMGQTMCGSKQKQCGGGGLQAHKYDQDAGTGSAKL